VRFNSRPEKISIQMLGSTSKHSPTFSTHKLSTISDYTSLHFLFSFHYSCAVNWYSWPAEIHSEWYFRYLHPLLSFFLSFLSFVTLSPSFLTPVFLFLYFILRPIIISLPISSFPLSPSYLYLLPAETCHCRRRIKNSSRATCYGIRMLSSMTASV
jgi:hypothetical protein